MTNLFNSGKKRDQIFAIDLGARTTKAVLLDRRDDGYSLSRFAVQDAPIYDKALPQGLLTEHLKAIVEAMQPKTRQVTIAIGAGDSLLRSTEFPLMPTTEMRQMLKFNSKNYLQQDLKDYIFDCFIVPPRGRPTGLRLPKPVSPKHTKSGSAARDANCSAPSNRRQKGAGLTPSQVTSGAAWPDECPRNVAAGIVRQGNHRIG